MEMKWLNEWMKWNHEINQRNEAWEEKFKLSYRRNVIHFKFF